MDNVFFLFTVVFTFIIFRIEADVFKKHNASLHFVFYLQHYCIFPERLQKPLLGFLNIYVSAQKSIPLKNITRTVYKWFQDSLGSPKWDCTYFYIFASKENKLLTCSKM